MPKSYVYTIDFVDSKVADFRSTYGLDPSYEKYLQSLTTALEKARESQQDVDEDAIRRDVFLGFAKDLYHEFIANKCAKGLEVTDDDFEPDLFNDYQEIIRMYSLTAEGAAYFNKAFDLELKEVEKLSLVNDAVQDLASISGQTQINSHIADYKSGKLPIRDMRDFANGLKPETMTKEDIATAFQLSKALMLVNETRSFWWRLFHPFRNNAEQRDSKAIEDTIIEKIVAKQSTESNPMGIEWYRQFATEYGQLKVALDGLAENLNLAIQQEEESLLFSDRESEMDEEQNLLVSEIMEEVNENLEKEVEEEAKEEKEEIEERKNIFVEIDSEKNNSVSSFIENKDNKTVLQNKK